MERRPPQGSAARRCRTSSGEATAQSRRGRLGFGAGTSFGNRLDVVEGLATLARSSEYRQAAELAGQYGQGHDPTFPAEDMADDSAVRPL